MEDDAKLSAETTDDSPSKIECNPFLQGISSVPGRLSSRDESDGSRGNSGNRGRWYRAGRHTVGFSPRERCYVVNPLCYDIDGCAATAGLFNLLLRLGVHKRE